LPTASVIIVSCCEIALRCLGLRSNWICASVGGEDAGGPLTNMRGQGVEAAWSTRSRGRIGRLRVCGALSRLRTFLAFAGRHCRNPVCKGAGGGGAGFAQQFDQMRHSGGVALLKGGLQETRIGAGLQRSDIAPGADDDMRLLGDAREIPLPARSRIRARRLSASLKCRDYRSRRSPGNSEPPRRARLPGSNTASAAARSSILARVGDASDRVCCEPAAPFSGSSRAKWAATIRMAGVLPHPEMLPKSPTASLIVALQSSPPQAASGALTDRKPAKLRRMANR
jgi:hypothetical protein